MIMIEQLEIHFVASKPTSPSKPIQGLPHLLKMFWRGEQIPKTVIFDNFTVQQKQIQHLPKISHLNITKKGGANTIIASPLSRWCIKSTPKTATCFLAKPWDLLLKDPNKVSKFLRSTTSHDRRCPPCTGWHLASDHLVVSSDWQSEPEGDGRTKEMKSKIITLYPGIYLVSLRLLGESFFDGKNGHSSKSGITTLPFQQMSSSKTKQCLDNRPLKKTLSTAMFLFQSPQKNYQDC